MSIGGPERGPAEVAIAKVASSGYLRGHMKPIALIKGGAQPRMMAEEGLEHFHDAEFEEETALDLSEIRAGVEAQLVVNPVGAQVASIEVSAVVQAGPFPSRARKRG